MKNGHFGHKDGHNITNIRFFSAMNRYMSYRVDTTILDRQILHMKSIIVRFCLFWFTASVAWSNEEALRLQQVYEREIDNIASTFRQTRLQLPQHYMTLLRNIELQYRLTNDNESADEIRLLRQQFVMDPTPSGLLAPGAPAAISQLYDQYEEDFEGAVSTKQQETAELQRQYRAALSRLHTQLEQQGLEADAARIAETLAALPAPPPPEPEPEPPPVVVRDRSPQPAQQASIEITMRSDVEEVPQISPHARKLGPAMTARLPIDIPERTSRERSASNIGEWRGVISVDLYGIVGLQGGAVTLEAVDPETREERCGSFM